MADETMIAQNEEPTHVPAASAPATEAEAAVEEAAPADSATAAVSAPDAPAPGEVGPILRIEHLHKAFGDNVVLKDLCLDVAPGEVIVVIGPSGCGKSTLLRCINGLEKIQGGQVLLDGEPVDGAAKNIAQIRQKLGMVFQSYDLFPHKTIIDNVTLAPIKAQKRDKAEATATAEALLERVGLSEKRNSYPRELSGGQKQRVAIARALAMNPEIMLLDEITAALDPEMVREVLEVILDLAREGKTMIIVTHEMSFARAVADRVIFLDGGEIVEEGIPEEFFDQPRTERAQRFLRTFEFEAVRSHKPAQSQ